MRNKIFVSTAPVAKFRLLIYNHMAYEKIYASVSGGFVHLHPLHGKDELFIRKDLPPFTFFI